jgi:hypothetical protein
LQCKLLQLIHLFYMYSSQVIASNVYYCTLRFASGWQKSDAD